MEDLERECPGAKAAGASSCGRSAARLGKRGRGGGREGGRGESGKISCDEYRNHLGK